jgi:hypothetical protein
MTGARTVVTILRAADAIREEDGKLQANSSETPPVAVTEPDKNIKRDQPSSYSLTSEVAPSGITIHLEISLHVTPSDLEGLGEKLRNFLQELKREGTSANIETTPTALLGPPSLSQHENS